MTTRGPNNVIAKYGIQLDDIWNFDETGFMMGVISSGIVVTGSERRGRPKSIQPGNREWVTAIQAINAEGRAIDPFIVVAGQYHLANWYQESNLPATWAIATTQNDWTDNKTGLEWLKHFDRCTSNRSVGGYRLLILDGHESRHSTDFEIYCEENNIITLCMPPHSSHLLQPLDVGLMCSYGLQRLPRRLLTPQPLGYLRPHRLCLRLDLSLNIFRDELEDIKAAPQTGGVGQKGPACRIEGICKYWPNHREVVVKEVRRDRGFGAVELAAIPGIMQGPVRRVLRPLVMSMVIKLNKIDCLLYFYRNIYLEGSDIWSTRLSGPLAYHVPSFFQLYRSLQRVQLLTLDLAATGHLKSVETIHQALSNKPKGPKPPYYIQISGASALAVSELDRQYPDSRTSQCNTEAPKGLQIGPGQSRWGNIHIADLSRIFLRLVEKAVEGNKDSNVLGANGLYFAGVGELWRGSRSPAPSWLVLFGTNARSGAQRAEKVLGWKPENESLEQEIPRAVAQEAWALGLKGKNPTSRL
ncbi:hypothetical protein HZ326_13825 [Fusarium oxysporum f. sp. albedinis]|nr:hypothetical protein HZ326_13825 [Fusarium oxysporum f. sp. albedinis]